MSAKEEKKACCITLAPKLYEKLAENKKLGKPWKINVSKTCREALEKKLERIEALHQSFLRLGLKYVDGETITTLKEIIQELEDETVEAL